MIHKLLGHLILLVFKLVVGLSDRIIALRSWWRRRNY